MIENIFVTFGGRVFQQTIDNSMGTNCASILDELLFYSFEADFILELLSKKEKKLAISLNFTFRYKDDVLSLNNSKFGDYIERNYPIELEIKDTAYTVKSASYRDLYLEIKNEGRWKTKLSDERDDFNFPIVNFAFLCSNIPAACIFTLMISLIESVCLHTLLIQEFQMVKLRLSLR